MKKYRVLKYLTRIKENLKPYHVGDTLELSDFDSRLMLKHGFVEPIKKVVKKKPVKKAK